jgi:hypothetical protein
MDERRAVDVDVEMDEEQEQVEQSKICKCED